MTMPNLVVAKILKFAGIDLQTRSQWVSGLDTYDGVVRESMIGRPRRGRQLADRYTICPHNYLLLPGACRAPSRWGQVGHPNQKSQFLHSIEWVVP